MTTRIPAEVFPPGEYLTDELDARGWSQADFADIIGRPVQFVSEIINAKKELTAESAAQIAAALGSEASTWLGLQAKYQLWRLSQDDEHRESSAKVSTRAQIARVIPLAQLEKRGVISDGESAEDLLEEVLRDFNMKSANDPPRFRLAAKRTNINEHLSLAQRGWLWAAQRLARQRPLTSYQETAFRMLAESLAGSVTEPADLTDLPERFGRIGVHLIFVEHFAGGKIDGAAFMLGANPVIAVSGRGKRFDKLFFALMHEVAHVLAGHIADDRIAMDDLANQESGEANQEQEDEANTLAERWVLGGPVRLPKPVTAQAVSEYARRLGVPPAFVVGNLQHRRAVPWKSTLAKGLPNADAVWRSWTASSVQKSSESPVRMLM